MFFPLTNWNEQRRHFDTLRCNSLSSCTVFARQPNSRFQTPTECISHGRKLHHAISVLSATCINPSVHARSAALCNNPFSSSLARCSFAVALLSLTLFLLDTHYLSLRRLADSSVGRNCLTLSKNGVFHLRVTFFLRIMPFSHVG